jgi:hypothetical protein
LFLLPEISNTWVDRVAGLQSEAERKAVTSDSEQVSPLPPEAHVSDFALGTQLIDVRRSLQSTGVKSNVVQAMITRKSQFTSQRSERTRLSNHTPYQMSKVGSIPDLLAKKHQIANTFAATCRPQVSGGHGKMSGLSADCIFSDKLESLVSAVCPFFKEYSCFGFSF